MDIGKSMFGAIMNKSVWTYYVDVFIDIFSYPFGKHRRMELLDEMTSICLVL